MASPSSGRSIESTVHGDTLVANAVAFGRLLRRSGLRVDAGQTRDFATALRHVGLGRRRDARAAARCVYARRHEDLALVDAAFDLFWRRHGAASDALPRLRQREQKPDPLAPVPDDAPERDDVGAPPRLAGASDADRVRTADFAALTPAEARDALALLDQLRPRVPRRRSRRPMFATRGHRPAPRRMLRRAFATGGEPLHWVWRRRRTRPRPLVLVCDISGSMERYSRLLLRFAHALEQSGAPLEVFVFGTRLTRITRQLRVRSADEAIRRVAGQVVDWNGGTRIGDSLHTLNRAWRRRAIRSGAIVLLVSDGWERGDPARLGREMAFLRRSCHRLLWLDPLASRPGFAPLTQGLQTALPHCDALVPCASVASLEQLAHRLRDELAG